jgi:FkbM family methyltransferase
MAQERSMPSTDHLPPDIVGRVLLTISCTDSDEIPKVEDAGTVRRDGATAVQVMHNGLLVEAGGYFGDWMSEIIRCLHGHHEPQEELVFHRIVQRLMDEALAAPAVVELGSFWAYYAMWFCAALPGSRALLMEPDISNFELGRRNFALNGLSGQATFVHGVIGPEPGEMLEFLGDDGTKYQARQFDLAALMNQAGLDYADVVLSDIQGAELLLLERARADFAASRVRFLIVSTHHFSISGDPLTHQRTLTALRDAGAHIIAEHSVPESYSGDGLIAVSFDPRDKDFTIDVSRARARESLFGELEEDLDAALKINSAMERELSLLRAERMAKPHQNRSIRQVAGAAIRRLKH